MKASDVIAKFLRRHVEHVFVVSGGANLHIIDSIAKTEGIDYVACSHEQACGYAADAYARIRGMGAACATSGPGATNLVTACAASYYDSVPVFLLTGQVATFRLSGESGVRQTGFQETPIVDMVRPVTKLAVTVTEPKRLRYELDRALVQAREGRPGPVVVDVCDDVQRADV